MLTLLCCTGTWAESTSDVLNGVFTVSNSGKRVQFSKGNLQYVNSTYQFAEHQYDYFGNNQDWFAFNSYSAPSDGISWYVMSQAEWEYLFVTRTVTNTLSPGTRYSKATIGTYRGVIVFPDNYTHPEGTGFTGNCDNATEAYTSTVSLEGWALMEAAGCVFLPAAGYSTESSQFNKAAVYQSTTSKSGNRYYTPGFYNNRIAMDDLSYNSTCVPVRLVKTKSDVTLTDGDDLTALSAYAGTTCKVAYSRSFTKGKSSTVCLPFAFAKGTVGTFYTFTGITKSGSEYIADMTEYTGDNLVPNTPYLFMPSATGSVDFSGSYAIPASMTAGSTVSGDWTFLGTYETVSWTEAPTGIYGFSAQNVDAQGISQGEFVKVGAYVRIRPMRCYLKYKNGEQDYAGARSMTRDAEAEPLPETIKVRLIGANSEVTAIGRLQTKTGEVTFDSDAWYSLDGQRIEGKPTRKGIYVNNGKKVIIK